MSRKSLDDNSVRGVRVARRTNTTVAKRVNAELLDPRSQEIYDAERRYQVIKLKRDGYSNYEIAGIVGCPINQVVADIRTLVDMTEEESAESTIVERRLMIERLDQLVKTYTPYAVESHMEKVVDTRTGAITIIEKPPDPIFAHLLLAIEARRAKALALDRPETKRVQISAIREYVGIDVEKV